MLPCLVSHTDLIKVMLTFLSIRGQSFVSVFVLFLVSGNHVAM